MKTYNWGIIGTGFIAKKMAEALPFVSQSRLYAVASRSNDTAKVFANAYNCKAYGNYEDLMNDPEVDIIYIATPHNLHCENTLMAFANGKHVLCEKPLAVNGHELRLMTEAAREKGLFLMEALWTRFNPRLLKVREILDSGRLGKIKLLCSNFGDRKQYDPGNRFFSNELIGGSLLDMGIYPLFTVLYLLGKPKSVTAAATISSTGVDVNCSFTLTYDDDAMAALYSSLLVTTDCTTTIYCEKGDIHLTRYVYAPELVTVKLDGHEPEDATPVVYGNIYNYEADEVTRCLGQGKTQSDMWSWADSRMIMDVMDEIRKQIGLFYPRHDRL